MKKTAKSKSSTTAKPVEFHIDMPHAKTVSLAGSFNNWNPSQGTMRHNGDGLWWFATELAPGRYEYRYVVDGQWVDDPSALEFVPNSHGSHNAVLVI